MRAWKIIRTVIISLMASLFLNSLISSPVFGLVTTTAGGGGNGGSQGAGGNGGGPQPSCSFSKDSALFGIPTWYEYMPGVVEADNSCHPSFTNIMDVWLIVLAVVDILLRIAAIIAVFMIIYGGAMYMTSMGSPETAGHARKVIINSLVGLMITVMATFLITFTAGIFH